jgi:hypothetical protein
MSGTSVEDVTSFVKEVRHGHRLCCQCLLLGQGSLLFQVLCCSSPLQQHSMQAMEILDMPEKLQHAILNPDKRLTVDLRVRGKGLHTAQTLRWCKPRPLHSSSSCRAHCAGGTTVVLCCANTSGSVQQQCLSTVDQLPS